MKSARHRWIKIAAWLAIVAVAIATVVPIEMRPTTSLSPNQERFFAMAVVGGLFVLAFPSRIWIVLVALAAGVAIMEPLQFFAVGRHPSVYDAMIKSAGAVAGAVMAFVWIRLFFTFGPRARAEGKK